MNYGIYFKKSIFYVFLTVFLSTFAFAQPSKQAAPRQDVLLNGLKVLIWSDPTAEKTTIKLRVHGGSMFDPKDKMGVLALLGDLLFPTDQAKAFFTEDLEGSLDVTTNYDYIQINATGKSSELLAMLETISNAVINPQITPENFKAATEARLKKVQSLEKNPSYLADRAAAKRLLGEFPYGRSAEGTSESLAKIDRADILFAQQRFLTSDNATLEIIGNLKQDYAFRATRQLFGGWVKSDKKVPATFAMAVDPDPNPQMIETNFVEPNLIGQFEYRWATRGISRRDKDYFAMRFLVNLLQNRFRSKVDKNLQSGISVVHERNLLPGVLLFKFSLPVQLPTDAPKRSDISLFGIESPLTLLKEPISSNEFDQTRSEILAEIDQKPLTDKMLDIDTFKLVSVDDEMKKLNSVTLADVQRVADKLSKQPFVSVFLQNSKKQ